MPVDAADLSSQVLQEFNECAKHADKYPDVAPAATLCAICEKPGVPGNPLFEDEGDAGPYWGHDLCIHAADMASPNEPDEEA